MLPSQEGERDSGVKSLVRGETPTSVGEANGEQGAEGDGHGQPGVKRRRRKKEGGRKAGVGVSPSCCCGTEDVPPLALYQHAGSPVDPTSHPCESRACPRGSSRRETGPIAAVGVTGARRAPSARASQGELELGDPEGRRLVGPQKALVWARSHVTGASSFLSPRVTLLWAVGGAAVGPAGSGRQKLPCSVVASLPPPPGLFIDSASYSAETNLRSSQVPGPAAACIISQAALH